MDLSATTVLAAINVNLSSDCSKGDRDAAFAYLEALKQQESCLHSMLHILTTESTEHNEWNRQLALSILEEWMKIWWNRIQEEAQRYIREQVVALLTSPAVAECRGMRTKLAVILSEIAQRQYPQQWPSFLDDIVGLWVSTTIPEQREVCIMCLEYLVQDCVDADFNSTLPTLRRQDILAGLKERLRPLLDTSHAYLVQCEMQIKTGDTAQVYEGTCLGNATLRLIVAMTTFAKPIEMCAEPCDMSVLALQLLSCHPLQVEAVSFLHALTSQKLETALFARLLEAISGIQVTVLPLDLEESITFQRSYAEAIYQLLGLNASTAMETSFLSNSHMQQVLGQYMTLMSQLLEQPSRRLAADVLANWIRIFKEKAILHLPWAGAVMAHVLRVYLRKTQRILWDTTNDEPAEEDAQIEFNDLSEYTDFRNNFNCQLRLLADVAAQRFPLIAVEFLNEEMNKLLTIANNSATHGSPAVEMIPQEGYDAPDSLFVRQFDALLIMWGNIISKIAPILSSGSDSSSNITSSSASTTDTDIISGIDVTQIQQTLTSVLESMLQWEPSSCSSEGAYRDIYICLKIKATTDSAALLRLSPPHLNYAVTVLMSSYGAGETPGGPLPLPSLIKRNRNTSASIAQLCDTCVMEILAQDDVVTAVVQQLVTWLDQSDVSRDDQSSFREALVAISDKVKDPVGQMNILKSSLGGIMSLLQSAGEAHFSSPQVLLEKGYTDASTSSSSTAAAISGTTSVPTRSIDITAHALGSLLSASKRVAHPLLPLSIWSHSQSLSQTELIQFFPFVQLWQGAFPCLLTISRALHGVWDPSFRTLLCTQNPQLQALYCPTEDMIRMRAWEGTDRAEIAPIGTSSILLTKPLDIMVSDLSQCRQQLYHILGQSCLHKAFYTSNHRQLFLTHMLEIIPYMENTHLSYMISRYLEPLVLNAPPCYYSDIASFLSAFLPLVLSRLQTAWASSEVITSTQGQEQEQSFEHILYYNCNIPHGVGYAGVGEEGIEIARISIITELTRTFSEFMSALGLCRGYLSVAVPTTPGAVGSNGASSSSSNKAKSGKNANTSGAGGGAGSNPHSKGKKKPSKITPVALWEPEKDTNDSREAQKTARRACLRSLVMGDGVSSPSPVTEPFLQSILTLMSIPDSTAMRTGVMLARSVTIYAQTDTRLITIVGQNYFRAAFIALIKQDSYSSGLEWELLDFLQETYCLFVLGLELNPGIMLSSDMKTYKQQQQRNLSEYQLPAKIMLESGLFNDTMEGPDPTGGLQALEKLNNVLRGCTNKKKRREHFKDFLTPMIERFSILTAPLVRDTTGLAISIEDTIIGRDSVFSTYKQISSSQGTDVLNIRAKQPISMAKAGKKQAAAAAAHGGVALDGQFSLANLFHDDDNEDL